MDLILRLASLIGVNALSRAILISTCITWRMFVELTRCQCPISGDPHFYKSYDCTVRSTESVSMPYLGRSSFLHVNESPCNWKNCVSMPYLGRSSFLRIINKKMSVEEKCVNALSRAILISTVPLRKPLKSRAPEALLDINCLKILKTRIFRVFFVLEQKNRFMYYKIVTNPAFNYYYYKPSE